MKQPTVYLVMLSLRDTNDELKDAMRMMKAVRESGFSNVICSFDGFNDDPREVWQIPEVRAMCRRLVGLGFVSYLDAFGSLNPDPDTHYLVRQGFGAGELWMMSEGYDIGQPQIELTEEAVDRLREVLHEANRKTDAEFGPFQDRRPTPTTPE